ncbi:MAG: family 20 glycosylhydrolase [Deltaproteobacteria bacterium]|nr:family 20 glycosylhydrolase [Deltaproteobacteria bacterium]
MWPTKPLLVSDRLADRIPFERLQQTLKKHLKINSRVVYDSVGPADLRIRRDPAFQQAEAYHIKVTPEGIQVTTGSDAGAYYAIHTLCDLAILFGKALPVCRIEDSPDFKRRGIYLDCSRGKVPTLKTLKQLVERLAHWKINELQLYIENVFAFHRYPEIGKGYSPLTAGEILSLQEHCRQHHVRLVGSLASFGHMEKILSLPAFQHLGELPGYRGFPGGTCLCPTDPRSIRLMGELYEELMPLLIDPNFNVCCDETWELGKGRSRHKAKRLGVGQIYLDFFLKIHRLCQKHGKRMNAWADILLTYPELWDQLPRDITLLNWEYEQNGPNIRRTQEISASGINVMVCPGTSSWLTHGSRIPNSMGNIKSFARQGRKHGAEGMLITDWGDEGHRNFQGVSLHAFAYGAAHAWCGRKVNDKAFTENFCRLLFNQTDHHLAKAITMLGNTYRKCGATAPNRSVLFDALYEPIPNHSAISPSPIARLQDRGLKEICDQLSDTSLWPSVQTNLPEFERIALKELKLAAGMDLLAGKKALAVKQIRNGHYVKRNDLLKIARQMESISKDFRRLWLLRNKPSRLSDNMRLFGKIQREMTALADK